MFSDTKIIIIYRYDWFSLEFWIFDRFEFWIFDRWIFKIWIFQLYFLYCFLLIYNDKVIQSSNYNWLTPYKWFHYTQMCKFIIPDTWILIKLFPQYTTWVHHNHKHTSRERVHHIWVHHTHTRHEHTTYKHMSWTHHVPHMRT